MSWDWHFWLSYYLEIDNYMIFSHILYRILVEMTVKSFYLYPNTTQKMCWWEQHFLYHLMIDKINKHCFKTRFDRFVENTKYKKRMLISISCWSTLRWAYFGLNHWDRRNKNKLGLSCAKLKLPCIHVMLSLC